jgi:putative endonuclease
MYFVYALYSRVFDEIYIRSTSDIDARLEAHNHEKNKGWTKRYQPWEIIYTESTLSKKEALSREKQLKSFRGRAFIRSLIQ